VRRQELVADTAGPPADGADGDEPGPAQTLDDVEPDCHPRAELTEPAQIQVRHKEVG